jgi:hypothetical protein
LSYPFTKGITWKEFIAQMKGVGVSFKQETVPGLVIGNEITVAYFENKMDGRVFRCVVDIQDMDQIVLPSMVRMVCKSLSMHPKVFGLELG